MAGRSENKYNPTKRMHPYPEYRGLQFNMKDGAKLYGVMLPSGARYVTDDSGWKRIPEHWFRDKADAA